VPAGSKQQIETVVKTLSYILGGGGRERLKKNKAFGIGIHTSAQPAEGCSTQVGERRVGKQEYQKGGGPSLETKKQTKTRHFAAQKKGGLGHRG